MGDSGGIEIKSSYNKHHDSSTHDIIAARRRSNSLSKLDPTKVILKDRKKGEEGKSDVPTKQGSRKNVRDRTKDGEGESGNKVRDSESKSKRSTPSSSIKASESPTARTKEEKRRDEKKRSHSKPETPKTKSKKDRTKEIITPEIKSNPSTDTPKSVGTLVYFLQLTNRYMGRLVLLC